MNSNADKASRVTLDATDDIDWIDGDAEDPDDDLGPDITLTSTTTTSANAKCSITGPEHFSVTSDPVPGKTLIRQNSVEDPAKTLRRQNSLHEPDVRQIAASS